MNRTADVVIIGGGATGCSLAYHLAEQGCKDVVICERSYLASGSTGRCAGGVRQLWGLEENCRFATESVEEFKVMHERFDLDVEYHQCGYITLAFTDEDVTKYKKNVALWQERGIDVSFLTPQDVREISPLLKTEAILGAIHCASDGWANPFYVTRAFAKAAERSGVKICTYTEVTDIETESDQIVSVVTRNGKIHTPTVVNAAGGFSQVIGQMVGIKLPTESERHQILVTEPLAPVLGPHVNIFTPPVYLKQSKHGNLIMGRGDPEPPSYDDNSSWEFPVEVSSFLVELFPNIQDVSVIRQWAGLYNMTPDQSQIMGEAPGVRGFYQAIGFSGHGFMFSPAVGRVMSEIILQKEPSIPIDSLTLERFEQGKLLFEPMVN